MLKSEGLLRGLWLPGVGCNAVAAAICRGIGTGTYPAVRDWIVGPGGARTEQAAQMFIAGLGAGAVGYGVSTPFWVMKSRLQAGMEGKQHHKSSLEGLRSIWHTAGLAGLYRGAGVLMVRGAMMNSGTTLGQSRARVKHRARGLPSFLLTLLRVAVCLWGAHSCPTAGYDWIKAYNREHGILSDGPKLHVVGSIVAAFLASTFSAPADVVMSRYQAAAEMGREYSSTVDCMRAMIREEGPAVFFRGWTPLFSRVAPLYILFLPAYEQVRRLLGLDYMV